MNGEPRPVWRVARVIGFALLLAPVLLCCAGALFLRIQTSAREGSEVARAIADDEAEKLNTALDVGTVRGTAEHIAATRIPTDRVGDPMSEESTVTLTPVGWRGETWPDEFAVIDVRIDVTVAEHHPGAFGDRYNSAGSGTRCYRFEIDYWNSEHHRIDCPASAPPRKPTPSPVARLPQDASERLAEVLRAATPDTLAAAVRSAFPDVGITVDTTVHDGTFVVAVGAPRERDCSLMIRTPTGEIRTPGYDPVQLTPGELGCSVDLYLRPPG